MFLTITLFSHVRAFSTEISIWSGNLNCLTKILFQECLNFGFSIFFNYGHFHTSKVV